ncbi:ABC transporter substrate-binding protein [Reinekea blandensis]|uniref:Spermidine/putrescine-binding periplasmic protein n=1 Tax=Reinekea blandensis MED297 TaxID=314283 RepID=A4BC20_9GAMM|nr:spermidine/putrescine ABC transporter substrate-binding protein [Reinekea blandensis]EAR10505.1 Spermidine/putrescine-binding periplasmic protein [Reinekea sp. MED297] [Reinekea blandensis MED297]
MLRCFCAFLLVSLSIQVLGDDRPLRVFTWPEYFDPEMADRFQSETGIELEFIYYDNDEIRDQIMAETQGFGFDVILIDDAEAGSYRAQNWIIPLQADKLSHLSDHGNQWQLRAQDAVDHVVPYGWGYYGVLYRQDQLEQPPAHWSDLFRDDAPWAGAVQMPAQVSELLPIALMAKGLRPFIPDTDAIKTAEQALINQQPLVSSYGMPDLEADETKLAQGEALVAVTYNSDAMFLMEEDDRLAFTIPKGGNIQWVDFWTISARSEHIDGAYQFLDFTLRPDVTAANVQYHYSATYSKPAIALLPQSMQQDDRLFPESADSFYVYQHPDRETIRALMRLINTLDVD